MPSDSFREVVEFLKRDRQERLEASWKVETVWIELLVGTIGSGKSTYARKQADNGAVIICRDEILQMVHGRYRQENLLGCMYRRIEEDIAKIAFDMGKPVVIDRTNLTREHRTKWIDFGIEHRKPVIAVVFPVEKPEIHARRRFEADPRGKSLFGWEQVAIGQVDQAKWQPVRLAEGFKKIVDGEFVAPTPKG